MIEKIQFNVSKTKSASMEWIETDIGSMLALVYDNKLALLDFYDSVKIDKHLEFFGQYGLKPSKKPEHHPIITSLKVELAEYFKHERKSFDIPIAVAYGSEFQVKVWSALLDIGFGETKTYSDIAKAIGSGKAYRAVGNANSMNPISIIIPCHRVINTSLSQGTKLGGYAGGIDKKAKLLRHEGSFEKY